MSDHADRFALAPIYGKRVPSHVWDGIEFREGQAIAYDVAVGWEPRKEVRHEGVIAELWVEQWRGTELVCAEVDSTEGRPERVWLHRDHVGEPGSFTPVDGVLF